MDGTMNQMRPIHRLLERAKRKGLPLYSLDLSSATDRLPATIQARLLDFLFLNEVPGFGQKWLSLLVDRDYLAKSDHYNISEIVKYKVGQPMGALSSWAMLAVVHHFIVQVAA
jgi:hypothetical protein